MTRYWIVSFAYEDHVAAKDKYEAAEKVRAAVMEMNIVEAGELLQEAVSSDLLQVVEVDEAGDVLK